MLSRVLGVLGILGILGILGVLGILGILGENGQRKGFSQGHFFAHPGAKNSTPSTLSTPSSPADPLLVRQSLRLCRKPRSQSTGTRATRKPTLLYRYVGSLPFRCVARQACSSLYQLPPRTTRFKPEAGPVGSVTARLG